MAYTQTVASLKTAIDGYDSEEKKLSELYTQAKQHALESYNAQKAELEKAYLKDRNTAAADVSREEKNYMQFLSSRGLGSSGEASQAKLNSGINLSNSLSELSRSRLTSLADLSESYSEKSAEIENDYMEAASDISEKRVSALAKLAEAEAAKEAADEQTKLYEESLKNQDTDGGGASDDSESGAYVPSVSAKDMAKQIVALASDGRDTIEYSDQNYTVHRYLEKLKSDYDIDDEYMKNLEFCLKSYGYTGIDGVSFLVQGVADKAEDYYQEMYQKYISFYSQISSDGSYIKRSAREIASDLQLTYVYTHVKTIDEFYKACYLLGFSTARIEEYRKHIDEAVKNGGTFRLGSMA